MNRGVHSLTLAMIGSLGLLLGACSGSGETRQSMTVTVDSNIVAVFGDESLTVQEFERRYAKSVGGVDAAAEDSLAEYVDFLERYVDFRLKVMSAVDAGVDEDSVLVAELDSYRDQLAKPYLLEKEVVSDIVDDLYQKQQLEVTASHILVRIPTPAPEDTLAAYEKISTLRDSVLTGSDFNDIASRNSEDPSAQRNGGHLGTFSGGRMILPFEERAYDTPIGSVSDVFRTQYGYHLLYVHDRGPRTPEIKASHILFRTAPDDTAAAWEKVQEAQARLDAGESFAVVARSMSEDPGSAPDGGSLGFFGRGRMVAPFDERAFELEEPGDRSDWFRTRFGYHIIQLDEIGELPTYDEAYDELKSLAQRLPRFQAAERAFGEKVRQELPASVDTTALEQLVSPFPPDSILYYLSLEQWTDAQRATGIATLGGRDFTLDDFLTYGMSRRAEKPTDYSMAAVYKLIDDMFDARAIDVAAANLEETDSEFAELMKEYRDGIILFRVMEDSVWNRASEDSAAIESLYLANLGSYKFPERSRVISYFASDDSLLTVLAGSWQPGDTTNWSQRFAEDSRFRMDTMYVADSTRSVYDQTLGLPAGEVVGPRAHRNGWIVLLVDGIEAPRNKTLQEARAEVLGEYQEIVEAEWLARLSEKYHAKTYPGHLHRAFAGDAEPSTAPEEAGQ